jgi:REP element-mobilizing transposase RayT
MSQSLSKVYVHLIFSTRNRERILRDDVRSDLHAYIGGIFRDLDSPCIEINTEPDHVHILFLLSRTHTLSGVVGQVKRGSSAWLKTQGQVYSQFHWQNGFGAFSVSQSGVDEVRDYIRCQAAHHKRVSFQDEFRVFLKRYEIDYDERYLWD